MAVSPIKMVFSFFSAVVCITTLILYDVVIKPLVVAWSEVVHQFGGNYVEAVNICDSIIPVSLLIIGGVSIFVLVFTAFSNSTENNPYLDEIQRF